MKEHREFVRTCEGAFELAPEMFISDYYKVAWAMQYLEGDPRKAWYAH